jgi:hypothetical protein
MRDDTPLKPILRTQVAFDGDRLIAIGAPVVVADAVKRATDAGATGPILVFDAQTSQPVELDLRGSLEEVISRVSETHRIADVAFAERKPAAKRGPGRPRLGVVSREITLLPRHWEWLAEQPGGASVVLRRLVDQARSVSRGPDRRRAAQESAYRFMVAMLGNHQGFEEATRALFAGDADTFASHASWWPADVRSHVTHLAAAVFSPA